MKTKLQSTVDIFEALIIILNISLFNTVFPSILFGNSEVYFHQLFILLINIFYLVCNGKFYLFRMSRANIVIWTITWALILIFLLEIPRYYIGGMEGNHLLKTMQSGLAMFSFGLVLNNIYSKRKIILGADGAISSIIKPYVYLCLIVVGISDVVFLLWQTNLVDIFQNPIPANFSTFIDNNTTREGASYFSPLNITIVTSEARVANLATFCGISYEPHIAAYFVTPAMFLLHGFDDVSTTKKIAYTILVIVFLITASSGTNALVLLFLVSIMIAKLLLVDKKNFIFTLFFLMLIVIAVLSFGLENMETIYMFRKITQGGDSAEYSRNFLEYVVSPTTLWGDGVFNVPYPYARVDNIGYLFSILVICFYLFGYFSSLKAIFQKNKLLQYAGLAALYFFLHSLKIVQLIFVFPFTVFIIFILLKAYDVAFEKGVQRSQVKIMPGHGLKC